MFSSRTSQILTALSTFALGFAAGMLCAPQSGAATRSRIADEARAQLRQAEARLKEMEARLHTLDDRIASAGQQVGNRMRAAADQAKDTILPAIDDVAESLDLDENEVSRELRHLTRK